LPAWDATVGSQDEWFGAYQGQRKIGWAHRATTPPPPGYRVRDESMLELAMLGTPQQLTTSLAAETDGSFGLRSFHFTLISPAATFTARGTSDGRQLDVRYGAGGREDGLELPLDEPVPLAATPPPPRATA